MLAANLLAKWTIIHEHCDDRPPTDLLLQRSRDRSLRIHWERLTATKIQEAHEVPRMNSTRAHRAELWSAASRLIAHRNKLVQHYYLPRQAGPGIVRAILESGWFDQLLDGPAGPAPPEVHEALRILVDPEISDPACRVDGEPVIEIASCLLHLLGAAVDGAPFPPKADAAATLRTIRWLPTTAPERRTLALRIREECTRFMDHPQDRS